MVCPLTQKKLCDSDDCEICYERSFSAHEKSKYWSTDNEISPRKITRCSAKKFWFNCKCGHKFEASLYNITNNGNWCPYCKNQKLCDDENCESCFKKSFASHEKSIFWSDDNDTSPREIAKYCNKKFWFDCKCEHTFYCSPHHISYGHWCPYCKSQKLCDDKNCIHCYEKSFASHTKSIYWSKKNKLSPREVFKSCNKKFIFDCDQCKHEITISPNNISGGKWCSYCAKSNAILCDDENCVHCFCRSFASNEKSIFWSDNNKVKPRDVFKSSASKFWFICECGNCFEMALSNVTEGCWCPICKNKTEKKLFRWLKEIYDNVKHQKYYPWCKNVKCLPYDFVLEDFKIIIELDGRQHFQQVCNWDSPEFALQRDTFKTQKAIENGYTIIRLLQEDVYKNKNNWESNLIKHIYYHVTPTHIFLSNKNEYAKLEKNLNKKIKKPSIMKIIEV